MTPSNFIAILKLLGFNTKHENILTYEFINYTNETKHRIRVLVNKQSASVFHEYINHVSFLEISKSRTHFKGSLGFIRKILNENNTKN